MKHVVTYLTFDGNCREAMTFYHKALGGDLHVMPFSDMPGECPPEAKDRVMHAAIRQGSAPILMASDSMPGQPFVQGTNFQVTLQTESQEETDRLFKDLGENGTVAMPLQDTFWGAYFGMLKDQFGIHWMFNFEKPRP